jgi:hypothetical protein
MTPEEMAVIGTWSREIKGNFLISKSLTDDPRSAQISDFCTLLNEAAPLVTVSKSDNADDGLPFIQIQKQIKYKGVPHGRELLP